MSKHTPGPWVIKKGGPNLDAQQLFIDHPTGKYADPVASCYSADLPECRANARLIAAAPDLLEALQDYMSAFGQALEAHGIGFDSQQYDADRKARLALSKATGEA